MVPGITSLAASTFAPKCFSYHDAEACGSDNLIWTWLIEYAKILLLRPGFTGL